MQKSITKHLMLSSAAFAPPGDPPSRPSMGSPSLAMPVETQVGRDPGGTVDVGNPGGQEGYGSDNEGLEVEIGGQTPQLRRENEGSQDAPVDGQPDKAPGEGLLPKLDLPDFDPNNADSAAKYESTFVAEDGSFNMGNLSNDFFANATQDPTTGEITGKLSEGTYKFLETKGIDRKTAEHVQQGQLALLKQQQTSVWGRAGGKQFYDGAVSWAVGGGYTPQQRQAFNAALDAGGAAADQAVDALIANAKKANPTGFRLQRRVAPARSVNDAGGGGGGSPSVEGFASYADYQTALRAAKASNSQKDFDEVRRRGKASGFY